MQIYNECNLPVAWIIGKIHPPAYSATCVVKGTFKLLSGEKALPMEDQDPPSGDLFVDNDTDKSCVYESDFACFKPRTDLLLNGKCFSPNNQAVQGCRATFQVGDFKKSLYIFGNRLWKRNAAGVRTISSPDPFTEMILTYENSFGGTGFSNNPHGKGFSKVTDKNGNEYYPLPNIEDPDYLITSPDDRRQPAGFGPQGRMWPSRAAQKMGTYDDIWLRERWPYFPADFDWSYFNCAPPDMQGKNYLSGSERFYFENLHPTMSHFSGNLPGLKVRLFVNKIIKDRSYFQEVRLNLDTLWVNPEVEKLNLLWRGVIEVQSEEMKDLEHCLVVCESFDEEPGSLEYYKSLLLQRLQEDLEDSASIASPPAIELFDESWLQEMEVEFSRMEDEFKKIEEQAHESEKSAKAILINAGIDPAVLQDAQQAASELSLKDALIQVTRQEEKLRESSAEMAEKLPPSLTPEEIDEIDKSFQFEPIPELDPFPEPLTRQDCETRISTTKDFQEEDLSKLDLTDLDFSYCNCRNTNFIGAILQGVQFKATTLRGANFAGCDLSNLNFKGADLVDADLSGASLTSALLDGSVVDNADFSSASLENASLVNASGFRSIFVAANLRSAQFIGAQMQEADFETANLESANFTGANLKDASVEGASGPGVKMQSADLTGLHASEGPDFTDGNFRNVLAAESVWEDAAMERADFSMAYLTGADFAGACLKQALFTGADLTKARFEKADLTDATMTYVNLFQGSFEQANLVKTDIRGSNCYEVEFYRAEIEGTRFNGSNLKMTKLEGQGKF